MAMIDDKITTKLKRLSKEVADIYDICKVKPTPEFWTEFSSLESTLATRLIQRPISTFEVDAAINDYRERIKTLCAGKLLAVR